MLGHGYIAHAILTEASARGWDVRGNILPCQAMGSPGLRALVGEADVDLVVNCAAYIPPSGRVVDCEKNKQKTIEGNILFPQMVAQVCDLGGVPLMHISTGCLFDESKEWEETDEPTRGWNGYCGMYVGSKLLAERLVIEWANAYVLRVRLPFDEINHPRNYLSKLASFPVVFDHVNSLTHRGDFAKAALDLAESPAPFGIYHMVNPGRLSAEFIVKRLWAAGIIDRLPPIAESPESKGTLLSTKKLLATGVKIRPVEEAFEHALDNWRKSDCGV